MAGNGPWLAPVLCVEGRKMAKIMSVFVHVEACWTRCKRPPCAVTTVVERTLRLLQVSLDMLVVNPEWNKQVATRGLARMQVMDVDLCKSVRTVVVTTCDKRGWSCWG
jgi:pyrimidine deaminase RibD-like protein